MKFHANSKKMQGPNRAERRRLGAHGLIDLGPGFAFRNGVTCSVCDGGDRAIGALYQPTGLPGGAVVCADCARRLGESSGFRLFASVIVGAEVCGVASHIGFAAALGVDTEAARVALAESLHDRDPFASLDRRLSLAPGAASAAWSLLVRRRG